MIENIVGMTYCPSYLHQSYPFNDEVVNMQQQHILFMKMQHSLSIMEYNKFINDLVISIHGKDLGFFIIHLVKKITMYQDNMNIKLNAHGHNSITNHNVSNDHNFIFSNIESYKNVETALANIKSPKTKVTVPSSSTTSSIISSLSMASPSLSLKIGEIINGISNIIGLPSYGINSLGLYTVLSSVLLMLRLCSVGGSYQILKSESNVLNIIVIGCKIISSRLTAVKLTTSKVLFSYEYWYQFGAFSDVGDMMLLEAAIKNCLDGKNIEVKHNQVRSLALSVLADIDGYESSEEEEEEDEEEEDDDDSEEEEEEEEEDVNDGFESEMENE